MDATAIVDRISTSELMDRYSLNSRTAIANRLKALGITEERDGKKLYVPVEAVERLDALHECLKRPGATLGECAAQVNGGQVASLDVPPLARPLPFIQLVHEIAAALRPQVDPLQHWFSLERAASLGLMLSTKEVKQLIGVKPQVSGSDRSFTRGSFTFTKSGKIGAEIGWIVTKSI
jgi:hypothetical protein